ncbi:MULTISPECIES: DUF1474 family protein [Staphylococcus]|uniref:DUF1474 family protein n=1 Tax=Staphylococcus agnetis TaxID=985762 RepID=A0AAW9YZA9_9STAP|nr:MULTISPECIES: DUF1474 family protein [Staphylococcus]NHM92095.1 DUF1474 family protein [Staphylococcus sp. 10602379]NJI02818.1 DUF1474 family protein [Staphylococcus agnetis]NJI13439.1 DUF1474 family protein [Staphylococcus agnetis]QIN23657.1 DUF1474 family protein [Staphylococcus agnetis]
MNWEVKNLFNDLEVLKQKYDSLLNTHAWFGDEMFKYEDRPANKSDFMSYAYAYHEARIHHEQTSDLMHYYLTDLERIIKKFYEIEKASSDMNSLPTKSDNA